MGQQVKCRDMNEDWEYGVVQSLSPLTVKLHDWEDAFEWDEVVEVVLCTAIASHVYRPPRNALVLMKSSIRTMHELIRFIVRNRT